MLLSSAAEDFALLKAPLEEMCGMLYYLGERMDKAAVVKLSANGFALSLCSALSDVFSVQAAHAMDGTEVLHVLQLMSGSSPLISWLSGIMISPGPVTFTLENAKKDVRLLQEAAGHGVPLAVLPAVARHMDQLIAAGHAAADFSVVGQEAAERARRSARNE